MIFKKTLKMGSALKLLDEITFFVHMHYSPAQI